MKLIDADALWLKTFDCEEPGDFRRAIEIAHRVDAVEVVHGRWELRPHPHKWFYPEYRCSICGGWKHQLAFEHENMNYCPSCGAKMDGGNEDE